MDKHSKIYVAGHTGLVGSALLRKLRAEGFLHLIVRTRAQLDLTQQNAVRAFFAEERPDYVFLAAAKVGGILANNSYPADFIRENLLIQTNVIHESYVADVKKLLFLGSSCIYPKFALQPLKEEYLLSGDLEATNEPYAVAKIAGIKMCQYYNVQYGTNFISVMPTNLYGPGDNFDLVHAHVAAALIRKFIEAKENNAPAVVIWGSGTPRREFLHVDDLADACLFVMERYNSSEIINIGVGEDITVRDLALKIKSLVGYEGDLQFDMSKPDGTPRKLLDVSRLTQLGWKARIPFDEGLRKTIDWYTAHRETIQI